jgi:hypothetical protein
VTNEVLYGYGPLGFHSRMGGNFDEQVVLLNLAPTSIAVLEQPSDKNSVVLAWTEIMAKSQHNKKHFANMCCPVLRTIYSKDVI